MSSAVIKSYCKFTVIPSWWKGTLLLMLFALFLFAGYKAPLNGVHWDAPIYLYRAKLIAETGLLQSYAKHSQEIANQVKNRNWADDESFPEPYWHFSRLGNSLILGIVFYFIPNGLQAVTAANWLYQVLLAACVLLAVLLVQSLSSLFKSPFPRGQFIVAIIISAFLYGLSDIYAYLSGNLVSEVPALFFLIAATLSLVRACEKASYRWAVVSGVLAFFLYVVRMESLWVYASAVITLVLFLRIHTPESFQWPIVVVAVTILISLFCLYSWQFYPLADPRLFHSFGAIQEKVHNGVPPIKLMIASGGLLWVGITLCAHRLWAFTLGQFAVAWIMVQSIPYLYAIAYGMPAQTRMYTLGMPALMVASSQSWALLLAHSNTSLGKRAIIIGICVFLVAVSHSTVYPVIRSVPGMWRLDGLRSVLAPPHYEKIIYPLPVLWEISQRLYGLKEPIILLRGANIPQEYTNLIRYFGPKIASETDLVLTPDPTNPGECAKKLLKRETDQIVFCTYLGLSDVDKLRGRRLFLLESAEKRIENELQKTQILERNGIVIYELKTRQ